MTNGYGNDGPWTPRKTNTRFSSAPTALGNRCAIPPHSRSRDDSGKWKAKRRLPTFPLLFLFLFPTSNAKNKGGLAGGTALHLQALRLENAMPSPYNIPCEVDGFQR